MKLGIRAHDLGRSPTQQLIQSLKDHHFSFYSISVGQSY